MASRDTTDEVAEREEFRRGEKPDACIKSGDVALVLSGLQYFWVENGGFNGKTIGKP